MRTLELDSKRATGGTRSLIGFPSVSVRATLLSHFLLHGLIHAQRPVNARRRGTSCPAADSGSGAHSGFHSRKLARGARAGAAVPGNAPDRQPPKLHEAPRGATPAPRISLREEQRRVAARTVQELGTRREHRGVRGALPYPEEPAPRDGGAHALRRQAGRARGPG